MKTTTSIATPEEIATLWRKLPSVCRNGKCFYRRGKFTVTQSFLSGRWNLEVVGEGCVGDYRTAQAAMDAADAS